MSETETCTLRSCDQPVARTIVINATGLRVGLCEKHLADARRLFGDQLVDPSPIIIIVDREGLSNL